MAALAAAPSQAPVAKPTVDCQGMVVSSHKAAPQEQRRNESRLRKLFVGANCKCADCGQPIEFRTAWASINLGTFCCIQCSGVHRSLGTHLSKVRAVAADDWNDDWVDNCARWGNAKANAYWEANPPKARPAGTPGASAASKPVADFIRAKYEGRCFAAVGEPEDWIVCLPLYGGWIRHLDAESGEWYYSNAEGSETSWEMPAGAELVYEPPRWWAGHAGWLEKKSGGKEGSAKAKLLQKWDRRYFVLDSCASTLRYYKSDEAYRRAEEPLGSVECARARLFLKEVKKEKAGELYRFTVQAAERELKLRAGSAEYQAWCAALRPVLGEAGRDEGGADDDDE